jgi:hypothetical protein
MRGSRALVFLLAGAFWCGLGCGLGCLPLRAQTDDQAPAEPKPRFRLGGELKIHGRYTDDLEVRSDFPFPPPFIPPGEASVFLRTPDPGFSREISTVTLTGEMNLDPGIEGRFELHYEDLYNRNPTSSDDKLQVREAWLSFGRRFEPLDDEPQPRSWYLLSGKAPRFTKQRVRRLESYGLWSTAVGRFEEVMLELGGTHGHFYWRANAASGNPLFMRDPNALAGDNGTPERDPRVFPGDVHPTFESGFPILYDTKSTSVDFDGELQLGGGLGWRSRKDEDHACDAVLWYFRRTLADRVSLDGTFYSGDLKLLEGPFPAVFHAGLPIHGDEKSELGLNFEAKHGGLGTFVQVVDQEIAGLKRRGAEADLAWRVEIPGVLVGETPVLRWVQPAVRVSFIDNRFEAPAAYPNPAAAWDWRKYDFGVRVGVVPGIDFTFEYSYNEMKAPQGTLHLGEGLATLRAGF